MYHPYSGAASYIYANEHPYTPIDPHFNDPYRKLGSFVPIDSVDSLPTSHPYSPQNTMTWTTESTWTADNTLAATQSQLSEDDEPYRRVRRDSKRPLIPQRRDQVAHPYARPLDSWIDYESVVETPIVAKSPDVVPRPKRNVTIGEAAPLRRSAFVPYEPRPFEERERERERDKARLVAAWRRKIQRRVKRALRRLRRFLEGL
ncbi:hypothetical protein DFH08DRAFT_875742 [Mycena albidolilacea]|uniref:Uncharacterized protein n=1 Tax=Mycena albidolilacea TaxID=1033008 RepID=A0AAD6ZUA7_9AGAR|nr:hypothetical protein DFH08DRAFT_875742 [Mycena albidolilacea]